MPSGHFSPIPTLYCWVERIDPSSPHGHFPLTSFLPTSEVCAWIRDEAMVGWGQAWLWQRGKDRPPLVEAGENAAITEAARVWDLVREKAQIHWAEGALLRMMGNVFWSYQLSSSSLAVRRVSW